MGKWDVADSDFVIRTTAAALLSHIVSLPYASFLSREFGEMKMNK